MSYRDHAGDYLNTRPHWAKEWMPFTVRGRPWAEVLNEVSYKSEIEEFKRVLGKIGKRDGWTLGDLKERFSNELYDRLIFSDVLPAIGRTVGVGADKVCASV